MLATYSFTPNGNPDEINFTVAFGFSSKILWNVGEKHARPNGRLKSMTYWSAPVILLNEMKVYLFPFLVHL
jgi:hypothetical protein